MAVVRRRTDGGAQRWRGTLCDSGGSMVGRQRGLGSRRLWLSALSGVVLCGSMVRGTAQSRESAKPDSAAQTEILVGAGDIVGCQDPRGAQATAKLIDKIPGTVFALGDLVYDAATLE